MKLTRKFLTVTGPIWVAAISLSQHASAQTAPAAAPAPKAAQVNAPAAKPVAPPTKAPTAAATTAPAAPAPVAAPVDPAPAARMEATGTIQPATTMDADANVNLAPSVTPVAVPPPATTLIEPAPAPAPLALEPPAEVLPTKLKVGNSGFLQINGLLQGWFAVEDNTRERHNESVYFRVRRAQLKFSGDIVKDAFSYLVLIDGAKTLRFNAITASGTTTGYTPPADTSLLLDLMVTGKTSFADVSIGQWKSPISYEGTTSSAELLLPERAFTTRYYGDNYDMGVRADKKFEYVKYSLQLLQGGNANQPDQNRQKELALRLEFTPIKGIMVGGAGLTSVGQRTWQRHYSAAQHATQGATRDIVEADVAIDMSDFIARGELLWGWAGQKGDGAPQRVKSRGMMAVLGYTIAKKVQPVVRLSYLDVDQPTDGTAAGQPLNGKFGIPSDEIRGYEFGVNYLIDGKFAKIQAAYGYYDLDNAPYRHQFILSGQASF
ncbi:MAG TPA: porin [Polyangiaceae bacterium]